MAEWCAALLATLALAGQAQVLYDGGKGNLPTAQGWSYAAVPGTATQGTMESGVRLNTLALNAESAGYARTISPALERAEGFAVAVRFHLRTERHTREERAGFSVIVLGADRRGIELGFWADGVFAQADEPLFSRGESVVVALADAPVTAVIALSGERYQLFVNEVPVLTGPIRDYTAFSGFPDVYETPNFIFLGDNTSSAAAEVDLFHVAIIRPPTLAVTASGALRWSGIPGQRYAVESSTDLRHWTRAGTAHSTTEEFSWQPFSELASEHFRVAFP